MQEKKKDNITNFSILQSCHEAQVGCLKNLVLCCFCVEESPLVITLLFHQVSVQIPRALALLFHLAMPPSPDLYQQFLFAFSCAILYIFNAM